MNPRSVRAHAWSGLVLGLTMLVAVPGRPVAPPRFDHSVWDDLLQTYVDDTGLVAYRDLQDQGRSALDEYLTALAAANPQGWPASDHIAFWLNAYNAGIVSAILQGRSAESAIGRVKLFKFWKFDLAGEKRTLDEIEHKILRQKFDEPRIHFALVCASSSCPPLRREAYVASKLETQLEDQGRRFVNDPARNVIDPAEQRLRISEIFKWFEEDFVQGAGSVRAFLARYVADQTACEWVRTGDAEIEYLDYDWSLNAQPDQRPRKP